MTETRTKNSSRNILWGIISKSVGIILPFVTRTITLYLLGANYLGIGTLFSSVLSFLSLTELGLSSAIVYAMYRPIAEGDEERVCSLLNYYRKVYRLIGFVMLVIGTIILPLIPYLINDGVPESINIYLLYYIYLINSIISYFFAGYRSCLLSAHQRQDVSTKILICINIFVQIGQILVLSVTKNFYIYAMVPILGTLVTNSAYAYYTRKMYPTIMPKGSIPTSARKEIKKKLAGLVGTKLNSIVVHSADTIVISSFLGLTLTAQYGNYYLIFNSVCSIIAVVFSSMIASIGNKLVTDSIEQNYLLFKKLSFVNSWIVCWCCTCFLCLYEPFMEVWVGKELALGMPFTILMVIYFYIYQIQKTVLTFKDAAGIWHADKLRPYVSMIVNVISNVCLVQIIGIYGIVLSTIIAFMISLPWANKVLFDNLFKKNHFSHLLYLGKGFIVMVILSSITYGICWFCRDGLFGFVERLCVCIIIPNILMMLIYRKSDNFIYWKRIAIGFLKKLSEG